MKTIALHDKQFEIEIPEAKLLEVVKDLGSKLNADYEGKRPLFIAVLNGSFMFASDLLKEITIRCEISFTKMSSYQGTDSTGEVNELIGISADLKGRHVVILEDIVDTGNTLQKLHRIFKDKSVASVKVVSLLFKPDAYKHDLPVDYVGLEIANDFIVGYGLDYDELGRNLRDIYKLVE